MDAYSLFIDSNLPLPLSKEEVYELLNKMKSGDQKARDKIIEHNIRFVLYQVNSRFSTVNYDKRELVSIGIIGLIKATDTFDISKNVEFASYAIRCIDNEILLFLRKLRQNRNHISIETPVFTDRNGTQMRLGTIIKDDMDLEAQLIEQDVYRIVRETVESLPDMEREAVMMYFGFHDGQLFYQKEIAKVLNTSPITISRTLRKVLIKIELSLKRKGITRKKELKSKSSIRQKTPKNST